MVELEKILAGFEINFDQNCEIEQIHKSAWKINDAYILKRSGSAAELTKGMALSELLIEHDVPATQFYKAKTGESYIRLDDTYYCLMKKMPGHHLNPYLGDCLKNGIMIGAIISRLHLALRKIQNQIDCYDSDYNYELYHYVLDEFQHKQIKIREEIIESSQSFLPLYSTLPRQLIHRDLHLGNLLFEQDSFIGFLDFDISQTNARLFDICYMGATMLVDCYKNSDQLSLWREVFEGVIQGYNKLIPLETNEIKAIPFVFIMIELTFAAFFSKIGQTEISKSCIDMTNWLFDNQDKISYSKQIDPDNH